MRKFVLAIALLLSLEGWGGLVHAQNFLGFLPTDTLVGRDTAGTGQAEIITLGNGLSMTGSGVLQLSGAFTGSFSGSGGSFTWTNSTTVATFIDTEDNGNAIGLRLRHDRATPSPFNTINLQFQLDDAGGNNHTYAVISAENPDNTDGSEDGRLVFSLTEAGSACTPFCTRELLLDLDTLAPFTSDGLSLGSGTLMWANLFLAEGGVINWDNGDLTLTQTNNVLALGGATNFNPSVNDGAAIGQSGTAWSDLFLAANAVINFSSGDITITNTSSDVLTFAGADSGYIMTANVASSNPTTLIVNTNDIASNVALAIANNRPTPAGGDTVALNFMLNSNLYAAIRGWGSGADGALHFRALTSSSMATEVTLDGGELAPATDDGNALGDTDSRWSDLFLAGGGVVNWNNGAITLTDETSNLVLAGTGNGDTVLRSADAGALRDPQLSLDRDSASAAAADVLGVITWDGNDAVGADQEYGSIRMEIVDATAASEDARMERRVAKGGADTLVERVEHHNAFLYKDDGSNPGQVIAEHWCKLTSDNTLTSVGTAQALLDGGGCPANGRITVDTGQYEFECHIGITAMSATSGNAGFTLAGTATYANIIQSWSGQDGASGAAAANSGSWSQTASSPASAVTAGTGTAMNVDWHAAFDITAAGTILPQITLVTAAAAVVEQGSWCKIHRLGDTATATVGAWD